MRYVICIENSRGNIPLTIGKVYRIEGVKFNIMHTFFKITHDRGSTFEFVSDRFIELKYNKINNLLYDLENV